MSLIYLVRHGQAGTRQHYDELSELGKRQARRLGSYLAARGVVFDAAVTGGLTRQRQTAEQVGRAFADAGVSFPAVTTDANWNEFDLDAVYRDMVPALSAADAQFREAYAEILRQAADAGSEVHHQWSGCDALIIRSWIEGRFPCRAETWEEFRARVVRSFRRLSAYGEQRRVVVFTSAVPVGICAAATLDLHDYRSMRLAGVLYNASYSILRLQDGQIELFGLNHVPHLEPALLSFR